MLAIFDYLSVGDLWGLAIIGAAVLMLAGNCSYQKHRTLERDRITRRLARRGAKTAQAATRPAGGVAAHA